MTIEELRVLITAKTDGLTEGVNKVKKKITELRGNTDNMASSNQRNIDKMKSQYDQLLKKLDNINARAELQQKKLDGLKDKYSRMSSFGASSPKMDKIQEQILRAESVMENLIYSSDKTVGKMNDLEGKMNSVGVTTERTSEKFKSLRDRLDQIKNKFNRTGEEAKRSTGKVVGFANMLDRSLRRVLRRILVYNVIYRIIRGFISYLNGALKTNNQFAQSLQVIRTNLRVAFQPIYDFMLPAINALMRGLATLTSYIASFTSALFGKTYKQSYDAAKGIETAKKAMDGLGGSAKKAKGQLAAFDEINVLQTKDDDDGGAKGFEMSMPEIPEFELGWLDRLKEKLEPTIASIERLVQALSPLKDFVAQGAIDFYNNFLVPVGNWVLGEGLPRFIDAITNGLGQIDWDRINESLNRLWEALAPFAINVGEGLLWLWENVLVPFGTWVGNEIVPRFLDLLANVLNVLNGVIEAFKPLGKWLWEEFLQPLAEWTGEKILQALDWLNEKLEKLGDWISENPEKFTKLATTITAVGIAIGIILSPISVMGVALVSVGIILVGLWKTNEKFRDNVKDIWNKIKELYKVSTDFIKNKVETVFNGIKEFWDKHGEKITQITKTVWDGIGNFINSKLTVIKGFIQFFIGIITIDWQEMKRGLTNIWKGLWGVIENIVRTAWDVLKLAFGDLYKNISGWFTDLAKDAWDWGKNLISGFVDGIKSMVGKVGDAVSGVASKVSDFIGFRSPTKEGPGRYADKWMPNMMDMLADGIKDNKFKIEGAVNMTANSLRGVQGPSNADSIATAVGNAMLSAMQMNNNNSGSGEVVLEVDGVKLGRVILPKLNQEADRLGYKPILQTE